MEILKAKEMGFCFGVRRAIALMERATREQGPLESLGGVVHNRQVVDRLAALGVQVVDNLDQAQGPVVAITSHGVGPAVHQAIAARGLLAINATCPFVRKAQRVARAMARDGFFVIVFGDADHPEVRGVLGWAGERSLATTDAAALASRLPAPRRLGILSQTTQSPARFAAFISQVVEQFLASAREVRVVNTICDATTKHQEAALELAHQVDLMLVVGGRNSANTRRLAELCAATGVPTHHVEAAAELDPAWLAGCRRAGITAGASTPDEVIAEVARCLKELERG